MGYARRGAPARAAYALRVRCQRLSDASSIVAALTALLSWPVVASAATSAWSDHKVVASRLIAGTPGADGTPRLGLHFRLAPEWHVYWKHPGDAGAPPQVSLAVGDAGGRAAEGDRAAIQPEILYPAPQRFRLPGGLEALGYAREVIYPLRLSQTVPAASTITASVDYVACAVECIPYHDELAVTLPAAADPNAKVEDELLQRWEARLPRPVEAAGVEWRLKYRAGDAPEIELEVISPNPPRSADQASGSEASSGEASGGKATVGEASRGAGSADVSHAAELFLEPAPGATFASPERIADPHAVRFRAAVRPDVAGHAPNPLRVAWTLTGATASDVALAGVATISAGGEVGASGQGSARQAAADPRRTGISASRIPRAALMALLALVPLTAALVLWLIPERLPLAAIPPPWLRGAGFLAAAVLVGFAYRLGALLDTARVAGVELSWLAVALAVQGAAATRAGTRRRAWIAFAVLAAAAGVWAASPGMLSF